MINTNFIWAIVLWKSKGDTEIIKALFKMSRMWELEFTMNVKRMFTLGAGVMWHGYHMVRKKFAYEQGDVLKHVFTKLLRHLGFIIFKIDVLGCTNTPEKAIKNTIYIFTKYNKPTVTQFLQNCIKILVSQVGLYYFTISPG